MGKAAIRPLQMVPPALRTLTLALTPVILSLLMADSAFAVRPIEYAADPYAEYSALSGGSLFGGIAVLALMFGWIFGRDFYVLIWVPMLSGATVLIVAVGLLKGRWPWSYGFFAKLPETLALGWVLAAITFGLIALMQDSREKGGGAGTDRR